MEDKDVELDYDLNGDLDEDFEGTLSKDVLVTMIEILKSLERRLLLYGWR